MRHAGWLMLCGLIMALPGAAQECRPLSGVWRMVPEKSFFAGLKNPAEQAENETLVIAQKGAKIEESWNLDGSRLHENVAYGYVVDGTQQVLPKGSHMPAWVRAEWQNCTLIVDKKMPFLAGFSFEVRNTYVLSPDGKQLTILQEAHSQIAEVERRLLFEKQ